MVENQKTAQTLTGTVVGDRMDKTITVLIERKVHHPLYKKYIKKSMKLCAHDADNSAAEGDLVLVGECKPYSKTKCWELLKVVEKSATADMI